MPTTALINWWDATYRICCNGTLIRLSSQNISPTAPVHRLVMSGDSRALCIGLSTGSVDLRDPRTFERVHTVVAHQGALADLASYQNLLITAGYSRRCVVTIFDFHNLPNC